MAANSSALNSSLLQAAGSDMKGLFVAETSAHIGMDLALNNSDSFLSLVNFSNNVGTQNATLTPRPRGVQCSGLDWHLYLEFVCVPVFTILGLTGNAISFLVLFSPVYSNKSYSFYLRALAVTDSLTLVITATMTFNDIVFDLSGETVKYLGGHTVFTCKLTEFLRHVVYLMSSWLVVCFTLDRYIAVCHPLQRARLCTARGAITAIIVLLVAACVSQVYILALVTKQERNHAMVCLPDQEHRLVYMGLHYVLFNFTLRFTLPFIVIAIFNGMIIFHIRRMRHNQTFKEREKTRNTNMAIYTLFLVCFVFVITLLPSAVISLTQLITYLVQHMRSARMYCLLKTLNTPFKMVRLLNYSTNFFLYGITGQQFRQQVRKLLCCQLRTRDLNERMRGLMLLAKPHGAEAERHQENRI